MSVESAVALALLAVVGAGLGRLDAGLGVLLGGGLAMGNLWWMTGRALLVSESSARAAWHVAAVLRLAVVGVAVAVVFAAGGVHPVGLVIGLTVLPVALVLRGLAGARAG